MSIGELIIYWNVIKKRLPLIGLLMGATLGAISLLSYLSKPVYQATTLFQVTNPLPLEVLIFREFREPASRDEVVYTQRTFLAVLTSEFVVGQVIEELDLDMDFEELVEQMDIKQAENTDFVALQVTAQDPKLAANLANTLVDKAAQYVGGLSAGSITANKEFIQRQLREIKVELDQARAALIQFQIENRTGTGGFIRSQESLVANLKSLRDTALAEGKEATAASYDEIIAVRERELQELILLNSEYELLQGTTNRIEGIYGGLLDKETEAELKENEILSAKFVQVIAAREPSGPLPRVKIQILVLGGVMSLALGITLAFVLEYLSNVAVETPQDAEQAPREIASVLEQDTQRETLGPARQGSAGVN